jgi:hypothetical protein
VECPGAQLGGHHRIRKVLERAQLREGGEVEHGEPLRLEPGEVGARRLDHERAARPAQKVGHGRLHGDVSAAVQDEVGLLTEEARRVEPQRHILATAGRVAIEDAPGLLVGPAVLHRAERAARSRKRS